jgi:hypothetical protein
MFTADKVRSDLDNLGGNPRHAYHRASTRLPRPYEKSDP